MNRTRARHFTLLAAQIAATFFAASTLLSQSPVDERHEIFVATPAESYLRYLQTIGKVPLYPWTSRPFSQRELKKLLPKDSTLAWHSRFVDDSREALGVRYGFIQPSLSVRYNSTFAYGSNDGPIWAGRGITSALQFGFYASYGPASLTVAPMLFRAQNESFAIAPTARVGNTAFGNPDFAGIDRPQRFGDASYSQADPGETTLRVDLPYIAFGASTANQFWGPAQELPVLLGNNAAGFPHVFVGSSEPLNIFIGHVYGKVFWGELFQSDYSPVTGPSEYVSRAEPGTKRFATGIVASFQPRGFTGLEIGGARFFHSVWPSSGIPRSYFTKFLQGFLKKDLKPDPITDPRFPAEAFDDRGIADNQLVEIFGRWVAPHSGFEMHAEYGREDHSYDYRDLVQEPDHSRVYSLGARKVFSSNPNALMAGRLEIMNFQLPQLSRYRGEGEIYVHGLLRQGHTYKGQMLGADAGVGTGAGSVMAVDRFMPNGMWTATYTRIVRREDGNYTSLGIQSPRAIDVSHAVGFQMTRFIRGYDLLGGLTLVHELNRDFTHDATNLNALVGVRYLVR